jgi:electron transport complex protein RnfD
MIFGGLGKNFVNPALIARAILMSAYLGLMSAEAFITPIRGVDAIAQATPLMQQFDLLPLFIGQVPGCIGEVSKLALLIGGAYLLIRKIISWHIPAIMLGFVFILSFATSGKLTGTMDSAAYQLLSGGLIFGALFMATDYSTSPVTRRGKTIYALGCGLLVWIFRKLSPMSEGVS